jgi:ribonuclease P protein component
MAFSCAAAPAADARYCAIVARAGGGGWGCRLVARPRKRFGLDATRRLRRKAQFERLLREGKRHSAEGFTFYVERRGGSPARLGILVSRRHAAAAVDRNRIKRCIREAFRLEQEGLKGLEVLVRPPYDRLASRDFISRLRELLRRLAQR